MKITVEASSLAELRELLAKLTQEKPSNEPRALCEPMTDDMSIKALPISNRACNILMAEDIVTVGQLAKKHYRELRSMPNMGRGTLNELCSVLAWGGVNIQGAPQDIRNAT